MLYQRFVRPVLFKWSAADPEVAHEYAMSLLRGCECWPVAGLLRLMLTVNDRRLEREVFGIRFPNPVGLAAGFDKNCVVFRGLAALGFGFIEGGTIPRFQQPGSERPRVFRLVRDRALINLMSFNCDGADNVADRLASMRRPNIPIGISIGKSKVTPLEGAAIDYCYTLHRLWPYGDYFAVNISSPNTPNLRFLQDKAQLDDLLVRLRNVNSHEATSHGKTHKPLLVKIAPDLTWTALDDLLDVCMQRGIDGLIAVNTTIGRENLSQPTSEVGGLSGRPLHARAVELVRYIHRHTEGKLPTIGVGGIFEADDAFRMFTAGASLIQVYTGFIYEGLGIARLLNHGLLRLMERHRINRLSDIPVTG